MTKTCRICSEEGHGYKQCPGPLLIPATPKKEGESDADYHKRLRYNEYMRCWTQRYMEKPGAKERRNAQLRHNAARHIDSPARVRQRTANDRAREWLSEQKAKPCMDCGGTYPPECMQFDHRPGEAKLFNIGMLVRFRHEKLLAEIAKCDVVCANCHAIRTTARARERLKSREANYVQPARAPKKVIEHA